MSYWRIAKCALAPRITGMLTMASASEVILSPPKAQLAFAMYPIMRNKILHDVDMNVQHTLSGATIRLVTRASFTECE